jgi:hypothetical protein
MRRTGPHVCVPNELEADRWVKTRRRPACSPALTEELRQ